MKHAFDHFNKRPPATPEQIAAFAAETVFAYNLQSMVTGATTCTNAAPAYLERFDYKATGNMTARTFTPYTGALAAPNAALTANRADELTRHIRNGAVTITGTADPAATVKYYPTAANPPVDAERDASGRWIAPNVPMHPMSNGLVRIQFRVDQDGQAPSFRLSEFSVNKVTTMIGNDANGSITNLPSGDTLAYDCEGNLACVSNTVSGAVSLYWYDQHGRRVAKSESGLLTLYIWDGMDIIATAHADGTLREYFTRGIGIAGDVGSLIAETRFSGGTATTTYLHSNWRGDVVMATDASGNVVGEYAYTTFGEQLSSVGSFVPRFTFSSKERDASGLVYHGFRYYSPVLCRWISEDPIGEDGGINLYQFCWNDPVNGVDAYGLSFWSSFGQGAIRGAIGATVIVGGAAAAITLGVPAAVITSGLAIAGAIGGAITVADIIGNPTADNIGYNLGAFAGSAAIGGASGRFLSTRLSPPGNQPASGWAGWNPARDVSQVWRPNLNQTFSENWWAAMGTGPNPLSAAGAVTTSGTGFADLFKPSSQPCE